MFEHVELFNGLAEEQLQSIAQTAVVRSYPQDVILINEGDETDSLYVVISGKVKVFLTDPNGKEVIVSVEEACDFFGELALLGHNRRSASVMTLAPSRFAIIPGAHFMAYLESYPRLAMNLLRNLARRMKLTTESVRSFALFNVYGRLTRLLDELATETGGARVIHDLPTQQTLANMVGASREMVNRILRDLSTGDYISVQGRRLTIHRDFPQAW